jgi:hypothetical protein
VREGGREEGGRKDSVNSHFSKPNS